MSPVPWLPLPLISGARTLTTPAKITWKISKPLGNVGISVDKLEMDKAGKFKLEASADKTAHKIADLKVDMKSDLVDPKKATLGCTYTGVKDLQLKGETTPLAPKNFTLEVSKSIDKATIGFKCGMDNMSKPDLGIRLESGKFFGALLAKEKLSVFTAHACYKAMPDLKVAGSYEHGGKKSGNFDLGLAYQVKQGTLMKAKYQQDGNISVGLKHDLAKGFTMLLGTKYGTKDGNSSWGLQLSME